VNWTDLTTYLWIGLGLLVVGSVYLIVEAYRVHKIFNDSIVGRLVKTLVVILLIQLYSLGTVSFAFLRFSPRGTVVLLPIVALWIFTLIFAIFSVRSAKREVLGLAN
jgi:hypothetical protein